MGGGGYVPPTPATGKWKKAGFLPVISKWQAPSMSSPDWVARYC